MQAILAKIKKKSQDERMNEQINVNQNLKISKDVITRKNQDATVIAMRLDESSIFFKIDGIAAQVWHSLVSGATITELISEFSGIYPDNVEDLKKDIPYFVNQLSDKKLLAEG